MKKSKIRKIISKHAPEVRWLYTDIELDKVCSVLAKKINKENIKCQEDLAMSYIPTVSYQACPICSGSGWNYPSFFYEHCSTCNGSGIIPEHIVEQSKTAEE